MASVMADTTYRLKGAGDGANGRRWLALFLFCLLVLFAQRVHSLQLIAHESVPVTQVSLKELRAIYTMRLDHWKNDLKAQVFVLPSRSEVHQRFCKSVLQVLPHQLQAAWYRLVFSGMGRAPIEVKDEQAMIEHVRNTPGAIGYLESLDAVSGEQTIKAIQVSP